VLTISVVNGVGINLGNQSASGGDVISNTQIVNNVIRAGGNTGIYIQGGARTASSPSSVSGLTIENDTLVDDGTGALLTLVPNAQGASGNQISGVIIRNTILWDPAGTPIPTGSGPVYWQPPDVVMNSLISGPGWAGNNGNINANPGFVNEPAGGYHLAAGSRAIAAGTTIGAPVYDLDGARRDSPPDIGAYEYGATPRPVLTVTAEQLGGSGTVTSSPAGINCGTTCSARFDPNTTVTLTAKPDRGSKFLGWGQPCSGKARCTVSLTSATSVTARFGP
jgi:Divergent InlB B-repeat domain